MNRILLLAVVALWSCKAHCGEVHMAIAAGDAERAKALIKNNPGLVSSRDEYGAMPLFTAARAGQTNLILFLISYKADVNATNRFGEAPLHEAVLRGHTGIATLLLTNHANVNATNN